MCKLLQVSRSSFYYWRKYPIGKRFETKQALKTKIKSAYFDNKGLYGSPRLAVEISCSGTPVSRTTVALHMKEMDLKSKTRGKFKVTTDSIHKEHVCDNLLDRRFNPSAPTMTWVSDITYIPTLEGFLYLTTIIDLFDRKVIASSKTRNMIASFTQSMSRKGNCWDNAVAESFFKTLKTEMIYGFKQISKEKMRTELFEYIEIWYNRKRRHSFLKNLSIEEFWAKYINEITKYSNAA